MLARPACVAGRGEAAGPLFLATLTLLLLALAPATASAQEADDRTGQGELDAAIDRCNDLRRARQEDDALTCFLRLYAEHPHAIIEARIGLIAGALERWAAAERFLSRAVRSDHAWVEEHRGPLEEALAAARAQLFLLRLSCAPAGASVSVDGEEVGHCDDGALYLSPGEHTVRVHASGYASASRSVSGGAQETGAEAFALEAVEEQEEATEDHPGPATSPGPDLALLGVGIAAIALGLVAGATAIALGVVRNERAEFLQSSACDPVGAQRVGDIPECAVAHQQALDAEAAAIGLTVGAVLAAGAGAALLGLALSGEESGEEASLRCAPGGGPGSFGLSCQGAF